ncbi:gliding motility-associated C-terminal domain-containing protein [Flectobacillus sp.]|uniref:T9SS type B sorting domain-containing protein n=1 Tax=Flectobacillus sp. TaxID=50419 RepID=UPI003BAD1ED2
MKFFRLSNITIIKLVLVNLYFFTSVEKVLSQCRNVSSPDDGGSFVVTNPRTLLTFTYSGDGNGDPNSINNTPTVVCPGQELYLRDNVTGGSFPSFIISSSNDPTEVGTPVTDPNKEIVLNAPTTPGIYYIKNTGSTAMGGYYSCKVIEVANISAPVYTVKICKVSGGDNDVKFTLQDAPENDYFSTYKLIFDFFGSTPKETFLSVTSYPFSRQIQDLGSYNSYKFTIEGVTQLGCVISKTETLTAIESPNSPRLATLSLDTPTANTVSLNILGTPNSEHKVWVREPSLQNTYNTSGTPVLSYTPSVLNYETKTFSIPDASKQYCFKVSAVDACNATIVESSNETCTTPIRGQTKQGGNTIIWTTARTNLLDNPFRYYEISKIDGAGNSSVLKTITNVGDNLYDDNNIVCGIAYTYKVTTYYATSSISNTLTLTNTSLTPELLGKVGSTVIGGQSIRVTSLEKEGSDLPAFTTFNYYRANSLNGSYTKVHSDINAFWDDATVNPSSQQYCYYMTWTGGCGESQPSSKICPIFAQMQGSSLIWTSESPLSDAIVEYKIFRVDPRTGNPINTPGSGLPYSSNRNSLNLSTLSIPEAEGQTIYLAIEGFPNTFPPTSVSNYIEYQRPSLVLSAQAFTPNGDGLNDSFYVQGRFIKATKMSIFDRWGNLVVFIENTDYQSNPQAGWDGTNTNGTKVPAGSYAFQLQVEDLSGNIITKEGSIVVIY